MAIKTQAGDSDAGIPPVPLSPTAPPMRASVEHSIARQFWHFFIKGWHGYGGGYKQAVAEKMALFAIALKQKAFPRRNLFAGPYAGEFGYEVMQWQGFVRARRAHYETVHVLTYPGRDY